MTPTFLMTWNPSKWSRDKFPDAVRQLWNPKCLQSNHSNDSSQPELAYTWVCTGCKTRLRELPIGSRFFLMKLGQDPDDRQNPKGIIGAGYITSSIYQDEHPDSKHAASGEKAPHVKVEFDSFAAKPLVPLDILKKEPTLAKYIDDEGNEKEYKWTPQNSCRYMPETIASFLETQWLTTQRKVSTDNENSTEVKVLFTEGKANATTGTQYERSAAARKACIESHGTNCAICGMSFSDEYGDIARDVIHVHHLYPLGEMASERSTNPAEDLRPLCPNCHAVVHLRKPPFTIEEVKEFRHRSQNG